MMYIKYKEITSFTKFCILTISLDHYNSMQADMSLLPLHDLKSLSVHNFHDHLVSVVVNYMNLNNMAKYLHTWGGIMASRSGSTMTSMSKGVCLIM